MKINFFTLNPNENVGSYRIWVRDLSRSLNEIGHMSNIFNQNSEIAEFLDCDVLIFGKSSYDLVSQFKNKINEARKNRQIKVGGINVAKGHDDKFLDFVIVGSPEEMCSLSSYDNIFIYPLIEREFENIKPKIHKKSNSFRICFHGHYPHLAKFEPFLTKAIESLSKDIDITLVIITGNEIEWSSKPKNVNIEMHMYDIKNISKIIQSCDVGVVPNITDVSTYAPDITSFVSPNIGLYDSDYVIRFKNKTNGGRAYVFYQHGIPVIHDISPSSFEFMSKVDDYICAHDQLSWEKNLRKMIDEDYRNKVSQINYNQFNISYNPISHAKKLVEFIESVE